jgi:hypothetical protein
MTSKFKSKKSKSRIHRNHTPFNGYILKAVWAFEKVLTFACFSSQFSIASHLHGFPAALFKKQVRRNGHGRFSNGNGNKDTHRAQAQSFY